MGVEETGFVQCVLPGNDAARYGLFVPASYSEDRDWPAILFLHGAGETGTDGVRPMQVGLGPAVARQRETFPYVVIFPQSWRGTWHAGSADADRALAIVEDVASRYSIDPDRVHLTGISMGGFGTWSLAVAEPRRWASIVPVCGGGDPSAADRIRHIPCWAFHGDADDVIPVEASRQMIEALRAAGAQPRYTEYPKVGHNSWDPAYATPELYEWWSGLKRGANYSERGTPGS